MNTGTFTKAFFFCQLNFAPNILSSLIIKRGDSDSSELETDSLDLHHKS